MWMYHAPSCLRRGKPQPRVYFVLFVFNMPKAVAANLFENGCNRYFGLQHPFSISNTHIWNLKKFSIQFPISRKHNPPRESGMLLVWTFQSYVEHMWYKIERVDGTRNIDLMCKKRPLSQGGGRVWRKYKGSIYKGLNLSEFKNWGPKAFEWVSKGAEGGYISLFWWLCRNLCWHLQPWGSELIAWSFCHQVPRL